MTDEGHFYGSMEEELQRFERDQWGTNDWAEIKEKIQLADWEERQNALTGMEEEQAEWESLGDD